MNRTKTKSTAFTLIELLTVVAIIAILVGLLFPAILIAIKNAEKAQAKEDEKHIEIAVRNFFTEYGRLPSATVGPDTPTGTDNSSIINELIASNATLNPKRITFLELPNRKNARINGSFCDPWGQPYSITLDTDYNNVVSNFNGICLVVSGGPDAKMNTPADNIINLTQ